MTIENVYEKVFSIFPLKQKWDYSRDKYKQKLEIFCCFAKRITFSRQVFLSTFHFLEQVLIELAKRCYRLVRTIYELISKVQEVLHICASASLIHNTPLILGSAHGALNTWCIPNKAPEDYDIRRFSQYSWKL